MRRQEMKEFLETLDWITVPVYTAVTETTDWQKAYLELLEHHERKTDFLIQTVRDLVKYIEAERDSLQDAHVFHEEDLSDSFKDAIAGKSPKVDPETVKRIMQNYHTIMAKADPSIR